MPQTPERLAAKKLAKKKAKKPHLFTSQGSAGQSSDSAPEIQEAQAPVQVPEDTAVAPSVPPAESAPLAEPIFQLPTPEAGAFAFSFTNDAHNLALFAPRRATMDESHREELYAASLTKVEELTISNTNLQNHINSKEASIASKDKQLSELENKVAAEEVAKVSAQGDLKEANKKLQEALKQIAELEKGKAETFVTLQNRHDELESAKARDEARTQEIKDAQERITTLEDQNAELREENVVLEEALHDYEVANEAVDKTQDLYSELRAKYAERGNEIKNLNAELDRYKKAASYGGLAPGHTRRVSSTSLNIGAAQNLQEELGSDAGSEVTDEGEYDEGAEDTVKLSKETVQAALKAEANKQAADSRPSTASTFASTGSNTSSPFETTSTIATPKPRKSKIPLKNGDQSGGNGYPFPPTKPLPLPKPTVMVDSSTSMNTDMTEALPTRKEMIDKVTHTDSTFTQPPRGYTDRDTSTSDSFSHAPRNHSDRGTFIEDSFTLPPQNHKDADTSTDEAFPLPPPNHVDSGTATDDPFPLPPQYHTDAGASTEDPFTLAPLNTESAGTDNPINDALLHRPETYTDASTSAPRAQEVDQGTQTNFPNLQHPDTVLDTTWTKTHYYTVHTVFDPSSIPTMGAENLLLQHRLRHLDSSSNSNATNTITETRAPESKGDHTLEPEDPETIRILSLKIPNLSRYQFLALLPLLALALLYLWHLVADYRNLRAFRDAFAGANTPTRLARAHALHSPGAGVAAGGYGCGSATGFSYFGYDDGTDEGVMNAVISFAAWVLSGFQWDEDRVARAQWVVARWFGVSLAGVTGG